MISVKILIFSFFCDSIQIYHARSLPPSTSGQEPNTYVKAYLKPDPTKSTKRKTKVVRKTCFPSFMETVSLENPPQMSINVTVRNFK